MCISKSRWGCKQNAWTELTNLDVRKVDSIGVCDEQVTQETVDIKTVAELVYTVVWKQDVLVT